MTTTTTGFYGTSVGKKAVMAVTGLLQVFFVLVHMLGNLQVYGGPERMNAYAAFLHSIQGPLWGLRIVLGVAALLHIYTGVALILQGLRSRPTRYVKRHYQAATASSRTMLVSGPLLLAYLVYHLLHQTFGTVLPGFDPVDVYRNVILGFSSPPAAVVYIAAMVLLALHIKHGIWSMFQSVGLNVPRYDRTIRALAVLAALAVAAGFISIPVAVLTGLLQ